MPLAWLETLGPTGKPLAAVPREKASKLTNLVIFGGHAETIFEDSCAGVGVSLLAHHRDLDWSYPEAC